MNQSDLNIILKPVAAVYNRQLSAEAVAGYFMALRSYTRLQVANAVAVAMAGSRYMPSPSEILTEIKRINWCEPINPYDEACLWLMHVRGYGTPDELTEADVLMAKRMAYGVGGVEEAQQRDDKLTAAALKEKAALLQSQPELKGWL